MEGRRQTIINVIAAGLCFAVGVAVKFVLTPYVVRTLGAEAYGFVGLSATILSYTGFLTIAVNALAGRFVAVAYQSGDVPSACRYYSSVCVCNIIMGSVILAVAGIAVVWLERMVNIPASLVADVKLLFGILALNNMIVLVTGTWWVGAFIRNRLDVNNGAQLLGTVSNALFLFAIFSACSPHIWYVGLAAIVSSAVCGGVNFFALRRMTPELRVRRRDFSFATLIELAKSGGWSVLSKLGEVLGQGMDLLIANLFVGAAAMGVFALTKSIPMLLLGAYSALAAVFSPMMVRRFAERSHSQLMLVVEKSIRILGLFAAGPIACLWAFGDRFYALWLPGQDARLLWQLTMVGTANMVLAMPLESLWNVFTTTNKIKGSSVAMVVSNALAFATMLAGLVFVREPVAQLFVIAGARSFWGLARTIAFLPAYGAECLRVARKSFYPHLARAVIAFAVTSAFGWSMRHVFAMDGWRELVCIGLVTELFSLAVGFAVWWWDAHEVRLPAFRTKGRMVHFVHCRNRYNTGDMASCPREYFEWPVPCRVHDIDHVAWQWIRRNDIVVLGGGGLFNACDAWNDVINRLLSSCDRMIAWGVGFNAGECGSCSHPIAFDKFTLIGVRDSNRTDIGPLLPCVSCMSHEFDRLLDVMQKRDVGIVSHRDHPIDGAGCLNAGALAPLVRYVAESGCIVTNSYHAAYWACLLGKPVQLNCAGYSEKFHGIPDMSLSEARAMNRAFYRKVLSVIQESA